MEKIPQFLTEVEVARILNVSRATLQQNRWLGRGLAFIKVGRSVRYSLDDLQAFIEANRVATEEGSDGHSR